MTTPKERIKKYIVGNSTWNKMTPEELLFEFIGWYTNEFEMKFTGEFKAGLVKRFLNSTE